MAAPLGEEQVRDGFPAEAPALDGSGCAEPVPAGFAAERSPAASPAGGPVVVCFEGEPMALASPADEPVAPAGLAAFPGAYSLDARWGSAAAALEPVPAG